MGREATTAWHPGLCRSILVAMVCTLLSIGPAATAGYATEYFVSVDNPNASDSNSGLSLSQPFKTLDRGAQALYPGDTLTITAGIYREILAVGRSGNASSRIVIRAYPGDEGEVIIRGSDVVQGWTHDGGNIWSVPWQPLPLIEYPASWPDVDENSRRRELVFVDGNQYEQVFSQSALTNGRFWMDDSAQRLRIYHSGNPNDRTVEVAVRTVGVNGLRSYYTFRGLRIEHVSTEVWTGALSLGAYPRVENCAVEYNNGIGIRADGNAVIIRTTSNHNGREGLSLSESNSFVESSETSFNSWRYGPRWAAGGVKIIGGLPANNRFVGHTARYNNGPGIWFDHTAAGNIVRSSFIDSNVMWGIAFEATNGPNWAINNVVVGTSAADLPYPQEDGVGILLREARATHIYNNTIVGVAGAALLISGDERNQGEFFAAETRVFNNILVNSSVGTYLWLWGNAVKEPRISTHLFDNNLFNENETPIIFPDFSNGQWIAWRSWSLSEWQQERGQDPASIDENPEFTTASELDFTLKTTSPAIDRGRYLAEVTDDFSGNPRPRGRQFDIGAFESPPPQLGQRRPSQRRMVPD